MNNESLAELSAVSKRYGKVVALDGMELQVRPAELLAVLGPNGAGKSTAISLMLGLQTPDAGTARLFSQSPLNYLAVSGLVYGWYCVPYARRFFRREGNAIRNPREVNPIF